MTWAAHCARCPQGADVAFSGPLSPVRAPATARALGAHARCLVGLGWQKPYRLRIVGLIERQTLLRHLPASLSGNGRLARLILEFQVLGSNIPPTGPITTSVRP